MNRGETGGHAIYKIRTDPHHRHSLLSDRVPSLIYLIITTILSLEARFAIEMSRKLPETGKGSSDIQDHTNILVSVKERVYADDTAQ